MHKYVSLLAIVLANLVDPGFIRAEDWPTYMHDRNRSGVTAERLELPLARSWTFQTADKPEPAWPGPAERPVKQI